MSRASTITISAAQWDDGTDGRGVSSKNHMSHRLDEMDGGGFVMVVGRLKSWNRCGKGWFKRVAGLLNP
jgi:hypothetical protein